jgi:glycosyltransferase involved in cell wall biosynthesis
LTKILFHSYFFPPTGGAGAQRPLKMVRYLSEFGYDATVVTAEGTSTDRWSPTDSTLAFEVPEGVHVHRVASAEPQPSTWQTRVDRALGRSTAWERWWMQTSAALAEQVAADSQLIYVWMQPYISAATGALLSQRLGKPWVADLGDPWALDEMRIYPSALHRWLDRRQMRTLLATASAIVLSTHEAAARLAADLPELASKPVFVIPNGFDAADFAGSAPTPDGMFRIVHTGYLHTALGTQHRRKRRIRELLGGAVPGVDILTRSHVYLVSALRELLQERPALSEKIELVLAGVLTDVDRRVVEDAPFVSMLGYVTHAESIALMRSASLLFLPMQHLPPGVRATIVPGKTYEYLASGSPILAAVPEGDARDILAEAGNAWICRPDDVACLKKGVSAYLERHERDEQPQAPRQDVVARYEYRTLARQLAAVFDSVLGGRSRS